MAFDRTNRGSLSKNLKKEKDSHPDYRGSINVNGVEHWFDAWITEGKNGKFLSCKIGDQKKQNFTPKGNDEMPKSSGIQDDDLDVPF